MTASEKIIDDCSSLRAWADDLRARRALLNDRFQSLLAQSTQLQHDAADSFEVFQRIAEAVAIQTSHRRST